MSAINLRIQLLPHAMGLDLPEYQTPGSSGIDLRAAVEEPIIIENGERVMIPTGLKMEIPAGYEGQVRTRSGLAATRGLVVLNSPGTLDADYRGEVKVILMNLGSEPLTINRGERVAQLVIAPVARVVISEVEDVDETIRGPGGFGSTGTD
ncbi:MAG: dUTP diphosphatase [Acidobacteria bacterium]|jgi:dUTP pyrophosphatase|nr:dUTP diphosphatase [Acidobacteriota bacterium]|tara:strand:+ start:4636 stop:5088 length:453 start_codon:yes stop_codon:yes gene_type:complete